MANVAADGRVVPAGSDGDLVDAQAIHQRSADLPLQWRELGHDLPHFAVNGNVVALGLYARKLTALPESIGELKSLTDLDLRKNRCMRANRSWILCAV